MAPSECDKGALAPPVTKVVGVVDAVTCAILNQHPVLEVVENHEVLSGGKEVEDIVRSAHFVPRCLTV